MVESIDEKLSFAFILNGCLKIEIMCLTEKHDHAQAAIGGANTKRYTAEQYQLQIFLVRQEHI